jgi:uncharacterized protein YecE (DUF72 family)
MRKAITKVGCCGFGIARAKYFQTFSVVEIQQSFYQPPRQDTVKRWRDEAPVDFEFTLKAWQLITHEASSPTYRRLKERLSEKQKTQVGAFRATDVVRRAWDTTLRMARLLTADKVVFQCPASFGPTSENKDCMREFFSRIDRAGVTCIWEPRGKWQTDEIAELCRDLDLVHCVDPFRAPADTALAPASRRGYPGQWPGLIGLRSGPCESVTAGLHYYRLHGITGYRHQYTGDELRDLLQHRVKDAATYYLFNNVSMYRDASGFKELLR